MKPLFHQSRCLFSARLPKAAVYAGDFEYSSGMMWAIMHVRWPSKAAFLEAWTEKFRTLCDDGLKGRHFLGCDEARSGGFLDTSTDTGITLWG